MGERKLFDGTKLNWTERTSNVVDGHADAEWMLGEMLVTATVPAGRTTTSFLTTMRTLYIIRDREVVGSTPGRVAIKWLVPGWVTVCGQVNHFGI